MEVVFEMVCTWRKIELRTALFSDAEREMVERFLETGEKGEGFRVLAYRVRGSQKLIKEDFDLMIRFLEKCSSLSKM